MRKVYRLRLFVSFLGIMICSLLKAQKTIVLQPNSINGKDAYLRSISPNTNYGNHHDFSAHAWTFRGTPVTVRGIMDFDLSSIPNGATINSANLSLYSYHSVNNSSHSTQSGSNQATISRVTSPWNENTVTWNNQPGITTQNQVYLPASNSSIQDYNVIVTGLIQDMINDPNNSHGLLFQLETELHYRRMLFASSDHPNPSLHPKLVITYTDPISTHRCDLIQPDGAAGKDAYLRSISPNTNYGNHLDFSAHAWTFRGTPVTVRGIIDFDLSNIPLGATIDSAKLSLYSYHSVNNSSHSTQSGSNQATISRVTSPWNENTVTWNNQPNTTTQNQVYLPASTSSIQDYEVDVSNLVSDMVNYPNSSHGFLFQLETELHYRRMLFASSDHPNSNLHPKLKVCYTNFTTSLNEVQNDWKLDLYPNPASHSVSIELETQQQQSITIELMNSAGQVIKKLRFDQSTINIELAEYPKGLYFVRAYSEDLAITKKLIIN